MNVTSMYDYTTQVLNTAGIVNNNKSVKKFVDISLERHQHFIDKLPFDEFGRFDIPFETTPDVILNDNYWLQLMLKDLKIEISCLAILQGKLWFVDKATNKAMPLTKAVAKYHEKRNIFSHGWFGSFEYRNEISEINKFLCFLGEIGNVEKKAVISVHPADYLRQAFYPNYATFSTCHNLKSGGYRHGPINYALDSDHLMNYLVNPNDEQMRLTGRVMMVIDKNFQVVCQRRFYTTLEAFGKTRAEMIRARMHEYLNGQNKKLSSAWISSDGGRGYIDGITVKTWVNKPVDITFKMTTDLFCFCCGKLHQRSAMYCEPCWNNIEHERILAAAAGRQPQPF